MFFYYRYSVQKNRTQSGIPNSRPWSEDTGVPVYTGIPYHRMYLELKSASSPQWNSRTPWRILFCGHQAPYFVCVLLGQPPFGHVSDSTSPKKSTAVFLIFRDSIRMRSSARAAAFSHLNFWVLCVLHGCTALCVCCSAARTTQPLSAAPWRPRECTSDGAAPAFRSRELSK